MTDWLVMTLVAPLASFGEEAGNVRRGSAARPTRSALVGLLGAALGIRRHETDAQRALGTGYAIATRAVRPGSMLRDYHTYQSLPSAAGRPATRADALARADRLESSITVRDYRADVRFDAAVRPLAGAPCGLESLAEALRRPRFVLSLGRRGCPLSWPLLPRIVTAETAVDAFAAADAALPDDGPGLPRADPPGAIEIAAETPADLGGDATLRRVRRIDQPGDRTTWQFSARTEYVLTIASEAAP